MPLRIITPQDESTDENLITCLRRTLGVNGLEELNTFNDLKNKPEPR